LSKKKLKILFFSDSPPNSIKTQGVGTYCSNLIELCSDEYEILWICAEYPEQTNTKENCVFLPSKEIDESGYRIIKFFSPKTINLLNKTIKEFNPDLVHIQGPYPSSLLMILFARRYKIPCILTIHTDQKEYIRQRILAKFGQFGRPLVPIIQMIQSRLISAYIANNCRDITAGSKWYAYKFCAETGIKKIPIIRPGIIGNLPVFDKKLLEYFSHQLRTKLAIPEDKKHFIIPVVTRVTPEKGLEETIRIFAEGLPIYHKEGFYPHLLIIGSGLPRYHIKISQLIKQLNIGEYVHLLGKLDQQEVFMIYQIATNERSFSFFFSKTDAQGMIIVEAALCSLQTFVWKDSGPSETNPSGSLLNIPHSKPHLLYDRSLMLLKNPQLYDSMAKAVNAKAIEICDRESFKKTWRQIYQNALN
jgi:glycosyltransferase involved in cell wall biosynthesis